MPRSASAWWIMKVEITCGTFHRVVETPPDIDLVGVSVRRGNRNCSTICIDDAEVYGISRTDDEIVIDDTTVVIVHFYRMPDFADIIAEFEPFRGMAAAEIEDHDLRICQII